MITLKVKRLESYPERAIGLIGAERPKSVLIKTRFGIHTFGLKFPIDVVVLNDINKVVKIKKNLLPNRIFLWDPSFQNILELPEGEVVKKKIKIGDKVKIID